MDIDSWEFLLELARGKTPQGKYTEQARDILGKPIGSAIKIRSDGDKAAYYLLSCTRRTRGGSQYVKAVLTLKEKLERLDGNSVRRMLDQIYGRERSMDDYVYPSTPRP